MLKSIRSYIIAMNNIKFSDLSLENLRLGKHTQHDVNSKFYNILPYTFRKLHSKTILKSLSQYLIS